MRLQAPRRVGSPPSSITRRRNGRFREVTLCRYLNDVLLRGGSGALVVHWLEITAVNATTGAQLYHNSLVTNHRLSPDNVSQVAQAGRGRWKVANENNNVFKTKGYHIEHNFGHGKRYLAAFLLRLNLLAFLFHQPNASQIYNCCPGQGESLPFNGILCHCRPEAYKPGPWSVCHGILMPVSLKLWPCYSIKGACRIGRCRYVLSLMTSLWEFSRKNCSTSIRSSMTLVKG